MNTIKQKHMKKEKRQGEKAIKMLKEDHQLVKEQFEEFKEIKSNEKEELVKNVLNELTIHVTIEEEIFYPAVWKKIKDNDLMDEALEEHHVVKLLISELQEMGPSDERYDAKFTVLGEMVKHHIKEEETEMFPKIEKLGLDLDQLGEEMEERKEELQDSSLKSKHGGEDSLEDAA
ncbi:MAG: hemerythrin domain-containing protein [Nitrospiria bacterium]